MINEFALIRNMKSDSQTFVVYGMGKSGQAARELLTLKKTNKASIFQYDDKQNLTPFDRLLEIPSGTLILSPGVDIKNPQVQTLISKGWILSSEINLACELLTTEKIIGITGSVGKSTVTSLLGEAVRAFDQNVFVGGNLGTPFAQYAIDLLKGREKAQWVILELSSYQLENCKALALDYSAITYLSANHLERYASLDLYYQAKLQISKQTKKVCFLNYESADVARNANRLSCSVEKSNVNNPKFKELLKKMSLIGAHNRENVALALLIVDRLKWGAASTDRVLNFRGLPHRLEPVGPFKNITFVNDSKATAIDSVLTAATAVVEKLAVSGRLHLLLGGRDKNLPWTQLAALKALGNKVSFIFFGECGEKAQRATGLDGPILPRLADALDHVFKLLKENDVLLLSPGGTSLDEFKNFEDRGNYFKSRVTKHFGAQPTQS